MSDIAPLRPNQGQGLRGIVPKREPGRCDPRLDALSAAVAGLVSDYGRTPTSATSWRLEDDCVVTVLADFMTTAEQEAIEMGHAELVREMRSAFAGAIEDEYRCAAEVALGCQVLAHRSEMICASSICVEIFLLDREP